MPAPPKESYAAAVHGAFADAGLAGASIAALANVVIDALDAALGQFVAMAMVQPGIAAVVAPPPAAPTGATTGPGRLMPPPAGAPDAAALEPMIQGLLASQGLVGQNAGGLGSALAKAIALALQQFTAEVQVAPGIPIAGGATSAPGSLL